MTAEFNLGEHKYRIGALSAITQHHLARKLAPALISVGNLREIAQREGQTISDESIAKGFCSLSMSISNEDMTYCINACLGCLSRAMPGEQGWAAMLAPNGQVMYNDIGLESLNILVVKVLDHFRIIDFFVDRSSEASPDRRPKLVNG